MALIVCWRRIFGVLVGGGHANAGYTLPYLDHPATTPKVIGEPASKLG
jgi:hypothetical protein